MSDKTSLLLGIDIGTYGSKGVICDQTGQVIVTATTDHQLSIPQPGWAEHDAENIWWHDFVTLTKILLNSPRVDPKHIASIGVSTIAPCVLPVDENGIPLRPAILYGIDTRAAKEINELENEISKEAIFVNSGLDLSSQAAGPKILWIKKNEPEIWKRSACFLTGSGYLVYKLTGEKIIDIYTAAVFAPMFDLRHNHWNPEITNTIMPFDRLPELRWSMDVVGKVTKQAAQETGLISGTPVIAGTADAASEALSAGLSLPGDLMIMYGSSQFFIQKTSKLISSRVYWGHPYLEKESFCVTGGMSTSGSLTRWFRDELGQNEIEKEYKEGVNAYESLANLATESTIGSKGLVVLPYFSGERSPINDPNARGMIFGLTLAHTRGDIYRAILEGVGYGIRHNLDIMQEEGIKPKRILAVGGGTKNPLWLQLVSDIAGIDQYVPNNKIGAAYGDAFMAGVGVGLIGDSSKILEWVSYKDVIRNDPGRHSNYEPYYKLYKQLYQDNAKTMQELTNLKE